MFSIQIQLKVGILNTPKALTIEGRQKNVAQNLKKYFNQILFFFITSTDIKK